VEKLIGIADRKAKANQGRRTDLLETSGQNYLEVESGGANEFIGKMISRSASTVKHIREVLENPKLREKVESGELTPNQAYEMLHPRKASPAEMMAFAGKLSQAGERLAAGDGQDAPASSDEKNGTDKPSAPLEPKVEHKTKIFPAPSGLLKVLVHRFQMEHIGELEEQLKSCDPELLKFITSMLSGSEAA
jgi:hypothetical protein